MGSLGKISSVCFIIRIIFSGYFLSFISLIKKSGFSAKGIINEHFLSSVFTDLPFSSSEALTIKGYKRAHEYGLFDMFEDDKVKLASQPSKSKTFIIEDIKDINAFVRMVWAHL